MAKRKRNVGLANRRKKGRYRKNLSNSKNVINTLTVNDSSNSNIILVNYNSTRFTNHVISDDEMSNIDDDDDPTPPEDTEVEKRSYCQMKIEAHRWTVFNFFVHRYDGMSTPDGVDLYHHWTGKGGVGPKIKKDLQLPPTFSVKERLLPIFEKITECYRIGEKFHPKMVDSRGGNRKMTIRMDSLEAQIIADSIEAGLSTRRAWENVNRHRRDNNDELLSESCVSYALRK